MGDHDASTASSATFLLLNAAMLTALSCAVIAIDARFAWFGGELFAPVNVGLGISRVLAGPTAAVIALAILVVALFVGRRRNAARPTSSERRSLVHPSSHGADESASPTSRSTAH